MFMLSFIHFKNEKLINSSCFVLNVLFNSITFSKCVESFDKLNSLLNSFNSFKSILDNTILETMFKLFHIWFELLIIILPFRSIYIKNIVDVRSFDSLQVLLERLFNLVQINNNFLTFQTSKDWNFRIFTSLSKL